MKLWNTARHIPAVDLKTVIEDLNRLKEPKTGRAFIPIIGEKFNGHNFIDKAREAGAVAVLSAQRGSDPERFM